MDGEPLKIIDAVPRANSYPDHKYLVVRSTARRSTRVGSGGPPETIYNLYSKRDRPPSGHMWEQQLGRAYPTKCLEIGKLKACADNPQNAWGSSFTGTSDEVNAQTPQQYKDLYAAVRVDATSLISMKDACEKVNGASLLFQYMRSFRT